MTKGKSPAFQFYIKDWLSDPDLRLASSSSRGIWIDLLCFMKWDTKQNGTLRAEYNKFIRMLSTTQEDFDRFIEEAKELRFCDISEDVTKSNTYITIINRRLLREAIDREDNRDRQRRFREKGGGDPQKWTAIRIEILERDNYMCAYCGKKATTVDHLLPKSLGGDESNSNLVACCKSCNQIKNNRFGSHELKFWKGFDESKLQNNNRITESKLQNNNNITLQSPSPSPSPNKDPACGGHFEQIVGGFFKEILANCQAIDKLPAIDSKPFNPYLWVQTQCKRKMHPGAIRDTLQGICQYWNNIKTTPWQYACNVIKTKSQNFHEREAIEIHEKLKNIRATKEIEDLTSGIIKRIPP